MVHFTNRWKEATSNLLTYLDLFELFELESYTFLPSTNLWLSDSRCCEKLLWLLLCRKAKHQIWYYELIQMYSIDTLNFFNLRKNVLSLSEIKICWRVKSDHKQHVISMESSKLSLNTYLFDVFPEIGFEKNCDSRFSISVLFEKQKIVRPS